MGIKYDRIKFRVSRRSDWLLAIQHAENNGFPVGGGHIYKLECYRGGKGVVNVQLNNNCIGLNPLDWWTTDVGSSLFVDTLDDFKHAVNCFCHDGYLDVNNLKVV